MELKDKRSRMYDRTIFNNTIMLNSSLFQDVIKGLQSQTKRTLKIFV